MTNRDPMEAKLAGLVVREKALAIEQAPKAARPKTMKRLAWAVKSNKANALKPIGEREFFCEWCGGLLLGKRRARSYNCLPCGIAHACETMVSMHQKRGPAYTKWRKRMQAWAESL